MENSSADKLFRTVEEYQRALLCGEVDHNHPLLNERRKLYDGWQGIATNEVDKRDYIQRLSKLERQALAELFSNMRAFSRGFCLSMVLAVGTTTFPEFYWETLKEYLEKHDKSKLPFVERKGEDIDIQICADSSTQLVHLFYEEPTWIWCIENDIKKMGVDYKITLDKNEDGTTYINFPWQGSEVIRDKKIAYGKDTFEISFPNCRSVHLSIDGLYNSDLKLKHERVQGYPFSLLFRGFGKEKHDFIDLLRSS